MKWIKRTWRKGTFSDGLAWRAGALGVVFLACMGLLLLRILLYQTVDYDKYQDKVINQMTTEVEVAAERGNIYDTNGILLATDVTSYRVFISPRTIKNVSEAESTPYDVLIADGLSGILGVSREHILDQTTYTRYLDRTLARQVNEEVADQVRAFIDEHELQNMVFLQAGSTRYYPQSTLACHVLGFTGSDGAGQYGLELSYDSTLSGTNGKYVVARDSLGNEMPYEYQSYIEAKDGNSIVTTIDVYIQAALEEELKTTYIESGGQNRACGIVMDVNTGAILAMATYPDFNLNDPRALNSDSQALLDSFGYDVGSTEYVEKKQELQLETWSNKPITEVYMPGSTFKVVTAAMAYEEDLVDDTETHVCIGSFVVLGRKIHCHKTEGHGRLTFAEGIQQSCNPWLMKMGLRIGQEIFYKYFRSFGYLEKTGIDLPGEGNSIFYQEDKFTELDLATSSFGQNFKISPIQQITAISAVANGGYLVQPHLVKEVQDSDGNVIATYGTNVRRQVVSKETCQTLSTILAEGVSGSGGAKNAYVAGYRVAAKTGTSEKIDKKAETGEEYYVCSCVGYAPADNPQIAVLIMVDEPTKGVLYGSYVAAPYVANVLEVALPYLGVEAVYTQQELDNMAVTVPSVVGWSRNPAKSYAEEFGFEVEFVGEGNVVRSQSPAAGAKVDGKGGKLILYTEAGADRVMVKVPNLLDMKAVAANKTLTNSGLNIRIEGTNNYLSGTGAVAISQSIPPGTEVEKGTVVTVTFRNKDDNDLTPEVPEIG